MTEIKFQSWLLLRSFLQSFVEVSVYALVSMLALVGISGGIIIAMWAETTVEAIAYCGGYYFFWVVVVNTFRRFDILEGEERQKYTKDLKQKITEGYEDL